MDTLYNALCEGQSLNPDEDLDGNDGGAATSLGGIDLSGFTLYGLTVNFYAEVAWPSGTLPLI